MIFNLSETISGGGGNTKWTLLTTKSIGTINTSSTTSTDTGQSVAVSGVTDYDILLFVVKRNSLAANNHLLTATPLWIYGSSSFTTKNKGRSTTGTLNVKVTGPPPPGSSDYPMAADAAPGYGLYPQADTLSLSSDSITANIYSRYNSTSTKTINGSYTVYVYGTTVYDLFGI